MGELPSDIRAVLEALSRKEISVKDAERLILIMKRLKKSNVSNNSEFSRKSIVGKEFIIDAGEECKEDLEIVNSKVWIKGKVYGDVELIFCDVYFSGEVEGDLEAVGCKIAWNGGRINGDVNIVGCSYTGKKPSVSGSVNEINNFFINGILQSVKIFVKPILSGIKVESRK